ncbi:PREDICTED: serine/threonine-protein kinase LMTK2 [Elephantulus edwardii]|uniref:serine/threonine-protein kinase LMTK2 n=1 Tax=Elephantulus edwardii TaxID=28737 RepID=UPI0003F0DA85|nr:PREDICTED: serine/threonine-protein kinase LMTK2 [Elephantulus edwardii]
MPGPPTLPLLLLLLLGAGSAGAAPLPQTGAGEAPAAEVSLSFVILSLCSLMLLIVLIANCVSCCKEPEIDFKEFEDNFDDEIDFTPPAEDTPSVQSPAEVFTLSVPNISLPAPSQFQPSVEGLKSQVARHSLNYIQEIGSGWFGKVLLGEIYTGTSVARVIVKELKASASPKEQDTFLKNGEPYYVLQHPNILQCVGQCVEAIPYLLVFEFCDLGDLKAYLRNEQDQVRGDSQTMLLQRLACEVAAALAAMHKLHFLHSDLALRNCYLTSDLNVKVGDYGIGFSRYKEDYIEADDKKVFPLRWTAPELVTSFQDRLLTAEQTKYSNIWSLGVTLWELFNNAAQPYSLLSNIEVLNQVIRERETKLPKPQLEQPYSDRWYEVLQLCWLSPDKRPAAEDVHRLLTYLRLQSQRDPEVDFEQQWNALKPNTHARDTSGSAAFPILDHFARDRLGREMEEVLTVTETSQGLSFEYVWEAAKHDHFDERGRGHPDEALSYTSIFFPVEVFESSLSEPGPGRQDESGQDAPLRAPGVVPVFDAHNLSVGSDYYIQLEEKSGSHLELDYPVTLLSAEAAHPERAADDTSQFVALRNLEFEGSSTEEDFFQTSSDPQDSSIPEELHVVAGGPESPFNNIFSDLDKAKDLPSHHKLLDLLELDGVQADLKPATPSEPLFPSHLEAEAPHKLTGLGPLGLPADLMHQNDFDPLNLQELSENFLFLQEKNLLKVSMSGKEPGQDLQTELRNAGFAESPPETSRRNSVDIECALPENPPGFSLSLESVGPNGTGPMGDGLISPLSSLEVQLPSTSAEKTLVTAPPDALLRQGEARPPALDPAVPDDRLCREGDPDPVTVPPECLQADAKAQGLVEGLPASTHPCAEPLTLTPSDTVGLSGVLPSKEGTEGGLPDLRQDSQSQPPPEDHPSGGLPLQTVQALSHLSHTDAPKDTGLVSALSSDSTSQDSLLEDSLSTPITTSEQSAETPDSMDVQEVLDSLSAHTPQKLLPPDKPADSGYETENLESPEWTLHPASDNAPEADPAAPGHGSPQGLPPNPVIVISHAAEGHRGAEVTVQMATAAQSSYRDSAYFSDNDSEPEKKSEEAAGATAAASASLPAPCPSEQQEGAEETTSQPDPTCPPPLQNSQLLESRAEPGELLEPGESCVCRQALLPEGEGGTLGSLLNSEPHEDHPCHLTSTGTSTDELLAYATAGLHPSGPALMMDKCLSVHTEGLKLKEPDVEGKYLGKLGISGLLDLSEDGIDADESSEDSDDSLHSLSSESEDELEHPVPLILSNSDDSRHLRSLLKPSAPATEDPAPGEAWRKEKKAVTFFDDVTVYLFDQETPTKELGPNGGAAHDPHPNDSAPSSGSPYLNRCFNSESSTDEEGGGFEWDDDFSLDPFTSKATSTLLGSKPPLQTSKYFSPPPPPRSTEQSWPHTAPYSRFSISPASIASFSLTHLTDSDVEQGGSSEDGEKD